MYFVQMRFKFAQILVLRLDFEIKIVQQLPSVVTAPILHQVYCTMRNCGDWIVRMTNKRHNHAGAGSMRLWLCG